MGAGAECHVEANSVELKGDRGLGRPGAVGGMMR